MSFTFGTFISNLFFSCVFIFSITVLLHIKKIVSDKTIKIILVCILLTILRLFVPIELFFTKSLRFSKLLPDLYDVFKISFLDGRINVKKILTFLWVGVAVIKGIFELYKYMHFRTLLDVIPNISNKETDDLLRQLGVPENKIQIKQLDVFSPVILDPIHPVIILPKKFLSRKELFFVLEHEVNHYKHHDLWLKFIVAFLEIIYWWNPFVMLLHRQVNTITEINNDITITKNMSCEEQLEYLHCLLKMADSGKMELRRHVLAFTENDKSNIRQRFDIVLNNESPSKRAKCLVYIVLVFTVGSFFINFEPDYPVPQSGYVITDRDNTYFLNKEGKYYFIINGINIGMVEKPKTQEFPIIMEK